MMIPAGPSYTRGGGDTVGARKEVPVPRQPYDAVVIGTGQAGKPLARSLAGTGWKVAVFEREDKVGGSCIVTGCTPTKTMVASARVAHLARRASDYGVVTGDVSVDLSRVRKRKRDIVDKFSGGARRGLERERNIDLIFGEARFVSPYEIDAACRDGGEVKVEAPRIFINTGTRTAVPDVPGIEDGPYLTNASVMELGEVPEHLVVIGGGYIGLEFGQMFRRFGARVSVVHRGRHLLSREDEDVALGMAEILEEDGVELLLSTKPLGATYGSNGSVELEVEGPGGKRKLDASHLLVAAGRTPNTDRLGLDAAGVAVDERGFIRANERLETSVGGIYALGDVKGGPAFTHVSYDDYRIIESNLLYEGKRTTADRIVPYCVFTDPELGRVGLTEREAKEKGLRFQVAKIPMTSVARALESDETRGFMKAIVDSDSGRILGAAVLGVAGGEVMSVLEVAMMGGLSYTAVRDGVFAHPTLAESLNNLFMTLDD
jgi:pyruvate/2-oxoglutarate dehydrogenase complex dihydrolipoamide dehydrogenase (E3) component